MSSIKKRNQSMSTSAFIVGLGLTEAILRIQAQTFKLALQGDRTTIGNVHILYSKNGNRSNA